MEGKPAVSRLDDAFLEGEPVVSRLVDAILEGESVPSRPAPYPVIHNWYSLNHHPNLNTGKKKL